MKKERKRPLSELISSLAAGCGRETMTELHGSREMLLSGCIGIEDYSPVKIVLDTVSGRITVSGRRLSLSVFRGDILSVNGKIESVFFGDEKRECGL